MKLQYRKISVLYLFQIEACLFACREHLPTEEMQKKLDGVLKRVSKTRSSKSVKAPKATTTEVGE